jgi:hypothetical protein
MLADDEQIKPQLAHQVHLFDHFVDAPSHRLAGQVLVREIEAELHDEQILARAQGAAPGTWRRLVSDFGWLSTVKLSVSPELAAALRDTANRVLFMREPESDR